MEYLVSVYIHFVCFCKYNYQVFAYTINIRMFSVIRGFMFIWKKKQSRFNVYVTIETEVKIFTTTEIVPVLVICSGIICILSNIT